MSITKKDLAVLKLDDVAVQDERHLVCGFTELGMVDPFSTTPSDPKARWNAIKKHNNKKNPDLGYHHFSHEGRHLSVIKFPSKPLLFKMMRACVSVYHIEDLWIYKEHT
jgi:hypothetical protein